MKIVFMGTPDFSVPVLEVLAKEHEVVCVYTRAPKEAGRGQKESKTPVHLLAEKLGIEVRTPKTLRNEDEQEKFKALDADAAVVAAYGFCQSPYWRRFPADVSMCMLRFCRAGAARRRFKEQYWRETNLAA